MLKAVVKLGVKLVTRTHFKEDIVRDPLTGIMDVNCYCAVWSEHCFS
jgi:hypothetical protein